MIMVSRFPGSSALTLAPPPITTNPLSHSTVTSGCGPGAEVAV
jgi:hypothetical protein